VSTLDRGGHRGQAVAEFSLAAIVFLLLLMGIVDFGMAIYKYNGVSQAAREIARVASVHQSGVGTTFGNSPELTAVVNVQKKLVPSLSSPSFACTDVDGSSVTLVSGKCPPDFYVNVQVTAPYTPASPLAMIIGAITMTGSSSAQIQQ
jgi:Flp pilus assembly protein TadG